jgi:DNA-binding MarR family transcriptional regulator
MAADPYAWDEEQLNRFYLTSIGKLLFDISRIDENAGLEMLMGTGYPVTAAHLNVVPHIDIEGTRLTTLAKRAHLTKQSAWEALKTMQAHGYIARTKDPTDSRAILVSWTPKGIDFLRVVCLGLMIREDDLAKRIGGRQAETLKRLLAKLRESYARQPADLSRFVAGLKSRRKTKRAARAARRRKSR